MDSQDEKQKNSGEDVPSALQMKHPLEYKWTLHYFENKKGQDWADCMHEVFSFNTVEDFWCMYNTIKLVNELPSGSDYYVFKSGIKPMWEDERNKNGGRWLFSVENRFRSNLNTYWLHTLLFMIGESFEESGDDVTGACINIRPKGDKISLWTADANNRDKIMDMGKLLKDDCYHLPAEVKLLYEKHSDLQSKTGSRAVKCLYQI